MRWASASVIGSSHIETGADLQDAYCVGQGGDIGFAIVSDGAGSAEFGRYGAWLTCRHLSTRIRAYIKAESGLPDDETISFWVEELRNRIRDIALARSTTPRQFAATLTGALYTSDTLVAFQIGDSASAIKCEQTWSCLIWPETGEYASTTYFVTDEPDVRLQTYRRLGTFNALALFSDGVGELALSYVEEDVFAGFLDPMIRPVVEADGQGKLKTLSGQLITFLQSDSVCERTDDDKTLVLIVPDVIYAQV